MQGPLGSRNQNSAPGLDEEFADEGAEEVEYSHAREEIEEKLEVLRQQLLYDEKRRNVPAGEPCKPLHTACGCMPRLVRIVCCICKGWNVCSELQKTCTLTAKLYGNPFTDTQAQSYSREEVAMAVLGQHLWVIL